MAGFGAKKQTYPAGKYVAQVTDWKKVKTDDFNDKTKKVDQYLWTVNVYLNGSWVQDKIYTGLNFTDMATVKDAQFVSKLTRLVRACCGREALPTTAEQAATWQEDSLVSQRFVIDVAEDPESGVLENRWVQYVPAPAQVAAPVAATPPPPAPASATNANGNGHATPTANPDPFADDAGSVPVPVGAAAGGDLWPSA